MKLLSLLLATNLAAAAAPVGESGVIINGRVIVLYRDGRKVADSPEELKVANEKKEGHSVDAAKTVIWYQTFTKDGAQYMCMTLQNEVGLSCLKK